MPEHLTPGALKVQWPHLPQPQAAIKGLRGSVKRISVENRPVLEEIDASRVEV